MNMSPWFHRGGLHSGGPCPTLYVGGEIIILRAFHPKHTLKTAEEQGVTFLIGAPPMLKMMCDIQKKRPVNLEKLKGIVTMGAPLEKLACIEYQKYLTPNIYNGYGTTETFWNTFLRPYDLPDMSGSAGRSCTDDDVAVIKTYPDRRTEPTELVAKDNEEVGEIVIKCPTKTTYYYSGKPEESNRVYYKGWMYTGDLGVWDENEFVTVVGRRDDMIVCSGENIHPAQIEEVINEHPKVHECAITSVPDDLRGQSVVAYIIKEDESLTVKELVSFCKNHPMLSVYKCPRYYRFVETLPYTATGKKLHYKVREMALEDQVKGLLERT
jgi:acyl-CoA synthetase (AMP-forming)/AMP-acid ligase II